MNYKKIEKIIKNGGVVTVEEAAEKFGILEHIISAWARHCNARVMKVGLRSVDISKLDVGFIKDCMAKDVRVLEEQCPYCRWSDDITELAEPLWRHKADIGMLGEIIYEARFDAYNGTLRYLVGNDYLIEMCDEYKLKINYCPMCGRKLN